MANPTPHRVTREEFDADPKRIFEMVKTAPVHLVDESGKVRQTFSCGIYLDENDCPYCCETFEFCERFEHCGGAEVRRLRAALGAANEMVCRHSMPYGWPEFQARHGLPTASEILVAPEKTT